VPQVLHRIHIIIGFVQSGKSLQCKKQKTHVQKHNVDVNINKRIYCDTLHLNDID